MARCNETFLRYVNVKKIDKDHDKVEFRVHKQLNNCKRINTKNFESISGDFVFNKYIIPSNAFECVDSGCVNSGVLTFGTATDSATYLAKYNAVEFATGIITLYAKIANDTTGKLTFSVSDTNDFTNSDVYEVEFEGLKTLADQNGFVPVTIDLSSEPNSTTGTGWVASESGAYFKVGQNTVNNPIGISTISIYDSIEEFETDDNVVVTCLTSIDGTVDVGASDVSCWSSGYDTEGLSLERTIVGNSVTPNYWKLNPLLAKGKAITSSVTRTIETTIKLDADGKFGEVLLTDANIDDCSGYAAQLADSCEVSSSMLSLLSVPTPVDMDEGHFQKIVQEDGTVKLLFAPTLDGINVLISYPTKVEVEELVANKKNVGGVETEMRYIITNSDGTQTIKIFPKVLVTSFPEAIGTEETEFSFTINIQPVDGKFYMEHKILA